MRRTHLREHPNILKRLLIHIAGFNLGLLMRWLIGRGTPKEYAELKAALLAALSCFISFMHGHFKPRKPATRQIFLARPNLSASGIFPGFVSEPLPRLGISTFSPDC